MLDMSSIRPIFTTPSETFSWARAANTQASSSAVLLAMAVILFIITSRVAGSLGTPATDARYRIQDTIAAVAAKFPGLQASAPAETRGTLAEGARTDGGRQRRAADGGNAARWGDKSTAGESVPALRVRHVDGANLSAHPIRAMRGRCHLSLRERRGGTGIMEGACRPLRGLQAGAASREDEDRLCKDVNRRRDYPNQSFDFLGYAFRARKTIWHGYLYAHSFQPAASPKVLKVISRTIRRWTLHHHSDKSLENLAETYNPYIKGWINYFGHFYRQQLRLTLLRIDAYLIRWARWKFKRLRGRSKGARQWLARVRRAKPTLFPHWRFFNVGSRTSEAV